MESTPDDQLGGSKRSHNQPAAPQDPRARRQPPPPTSQAYSRPGDANFVPPAAQGGDWISDPHTPPAARAEDLMADQSMPAPISGSYEDQPPPPTGQAFSKPGDEDFVPPEAQAKDRMDDQSTPAPTAGGGGSDSGGGPSIGNREQNASPNGGQSSASNPSEGRFNKMLNNSDGVNGIKNRADNLEKKVKQGKDALQNVGKAVNAVDKGAKAGKAATTATGAGAVPVLAETAAEAAVKNTIKRLKGDFSVSKKTIVAVLLPIFLIIGFMIALIYGPKFFMHTFRDSTDKKLMSRVDYTLEKRANLYVADYAEDVLLPNLQQCGTAINTECYAGQPGATEQHVTLYNSWKKGKIMERIKLRYGFTFKLGNSGQWRDIGVYKNDKQIMTYGDYYAAGLALEHVMGVTEAHGVSERWVMRHTINSRFGGKWCIFMCADADALTNENIDILSKMKLKVASRALSKSAARVAALLSCESGCTPTSLAISARDAALQALPNADDKFLSEMFEEFKPGQLLVDFLTSKVLENLFTKQNIVRAAKVAFFVPIQAFHLVSSVLSGSLNFVQGLLESGDLNPFTAEKNMSEYNDYGTSSDSSMDEVETANLPIKKQGAVFRYYKAAPRSRFIQKVRGIQSGSTMKCEDGTIIKGDDVQSTCVENHIIQDIPVDAVKTSPLFTFFGKAASAIKSVLSVIPGLDGPLDTVAGWAQSSLSSIGFITTTVTPSVYKVDPAGTPLAGTMYGAAKLANEFAFMIGYEDIDGGHAGYAGKLLTPVTQATLDLAINQNEEQKLQQQSVFARYLDPRNSTSLFSTTALNFASSMPLLIDEPFIPKFNPFSLIGNLGMALGFSQTASAATADLGDRYQYFRIHPIGYDTNELNTLPKSLTPEVCARLSQERADSFIEQDDDIEVPTKADICTGDKSVVIPSLTGWTQLKSQADLDTYNQSGLPISQTGGGRTAIPGAPINKKDDTSGLACAAGATSERVETVAAGGPEERKIKLCTYGGVRDVNASWSPYVAQMLADAKADGVNLVGGGFRTSAQQIALRKAHCGTSQYAIYQMPSRQCSPPTATPGNSNHELGLAIDFGSNPPCNTRSTECYRWLASNAARYVDSTGKRMIINYAVEPWHWSFNGS